MTRTKQGTAVLLASFALLVFSGCHTTVVQPVERPDPQRDHRDQPVPPPDHRDDHDQPPPPPDHRDDRQ